MESNIDLPFVIDCLRIFTTFFSHTWNWKMYKSLHIYNFGWVKEVQNTASASEICSLAFLAMNVNYVYNMTLI